MVLVGRIREIKGRVNVLNHIHIVILKTCIEC